MEKVCPWCGQTSDRGRLKIRSGGVSEGFTHKMAAWEICIHDGGVSEFYPQDGGVSKIFYPQDGGMGVLPIRCRHF